MAEEEEKSAMSQSRKSMSRYGDDDDDEDEEDEESDEENARVFYKPSELLVSPILISVMRYDPTKDSNWQAFLAPEETLLLC